MLGVCLLFVGHFHFVETTTRQTVSAFFITELTHGIVAYIIIFVHNVSVPIIASYWCFAVFADVDVLVDVALCVIYHVITASAIATIRQLPFRIKKTLFRFSVML